MARKKNEIQPVIKADETLRDDVVQEFANEQNANALADGIILNATDAILKAGYIQGIEFTRRVGDVAIAQIFLSLKQSKSYKGIPYSDSDGTTRRVGSFEEFCQAFFSKSYNRCLELSQNLQLLGTDLYEQSELIGFRARDYQALKALPADEQEIVKQAIETDDRDTVIDLLQEMALKHAKEKAAMQKQQFEDRENLEVRGKMLADERTAHQETKLELERNKRRIQKLTPSERTQELREEIARLTHGFEYSIRGTFCQSLLELEKETEDGVGQDHRAFMSLMVRQVELACADIREKFLLPIFERGDVEFSWIDHLGSVRKSGEALSHSWALPADAQAKLDKMIEQRHEH
jgi:hypothetical protein